MEMGRANALLQGSGISIYQPPASPLDVNREELLASFKKWFQKFRATRYFRITYLLLLGAVVAQLYVLSRSTVFCLVVLLIPISIFVVPYWLGERKLKRFAGNALVVFLVAILLAAGMSTQALLAQGQSLELRSFPDIASPTMALANGSVDPYHAPPSTSFAFRVNLTTTQNGTPDGYRVYLNLTVVRGVNVAQSSYRMAFSPGNFSGANTRNGSRYEARLSNLTDAVYLYAFSVWDQDKNWTYTTVDFGPLTASGWVYFGFFAYLWSALSPVTLVALLTYFAILFLWWYTKRSREARMKTLTRAGELPKEEKKTGPKRETSSGGKASKVAAFTCTNCGADVDETDTKCPKCGAVFED